MKLRPFELVLVTGFGLLALLALVLMSTYRPAPDTSGPTLGGPVLVWGTLDSTAFYSVLRPLAEENEMYRQISYVQKDAGTFDNDVVNALADGVGPDIVILPHEKLVQYRPRLLPISYSQYPFADFRNMYVDGGEIFAMTDGIYALPLLIDPLVMYWNRDILASYNYVTPPTTWEVLVNDMVPTLVQRDFSRTIIRSPLAFGEYQNVANAYGVLSMLLLQGGSRLVSEGQQQYQIQLNQHRDDMGTPFEQAVTFYTNFANPSNPLYSWNRAQGLDRNEFLAEELVFYFGRGSEARGIALQNPNLNFTLAEVPQGATATVRRTYGTIYGMAVLRNAKNVNGAYQTMQVFGSDANARQIADALGMAPASRSLIAAGSNDTYGRVVYSSAAVARGWLNPNLDTTNQIFTRMVEDVLANRARPAQATGDAVGRLREVY